MKIINCIFFILTIFVLSSIPMYGFYDTSASNPLYIIQQNIQYVPDPTPQPTIVPQGITDVTIIDSVTKDPISGARVDTHMVENLISTGYTNSQGKYIRVSEWTVSYVEISADDYDTLVIEGQALGVFELTRTIPVPAYYYEVSGVITDTNTGEPIIDAKVDISGYLNGDWGYTSTQTDASGYYSLTRNTGNTAKLVVTKENYTPAATTLEPGIYNLDFSLKTIPSGTGTMWIVPADQTVQVKDRFTVEVHVNTGEQKFAAYGVNLTYNSNILTLEKADPGPDGFLSATSVNQPGNQVLSGFDPQGTGPSEDLHILTITFLAHATGSDVPDLIVNDISDVNFATIGIPTGINGKVTVVESSLGDVDDNGEIDIVDALLVARYYVSGNSSILDLSRADVNKDGNVDIIDALRIAQYYVGIITSF
ncbi:MAG: carboxypeptidase regulatory-like domain-containing protein [Spirochaetales bacterium]|nr:carboxypeptidase regulatory-like domain-containing protein [Spirochaetales bacterium]